MTIQRIRRRLAAVLYLLVLMSPAVAQVTAIRAGAVVDPETASVKERQVLLIENGRIKAMGQDVAIPPDAGVLDLSDRTVLPGLMDAHTHLLARIDPHWDLGDTWIMAVQRRPGWRAILGTRYAREMLDSGFTTVRDLGNSGDYLDVDLEKAIRFMGVPGPTIIPAGRIIAPYGGQFWDTPADARLLENPEYSFADTRDEMRKAVRENIYWGAKVIKIVVDGQRYQYNVDDVKFIVAEAARAGVKVAAHAQTQTGARTAIEAGVASVEHGWVMTDDDLALARKNGVVLVSTDFTYEGLVANGFTEERARRTHQQRVERLRRAYKAGVTIVFGTDVMNHLKLSRGVQAIDYVESFIEAGVPPPDVLRAMTTSAAKLLGVENERGTLKQGHAADLIAVPGNPLVDIRLLRKVDFVMKEGVVYRNDRASPPPR